MLIVGESGTGKELVRARLFTRTRSAPTSRSSRQLRGAARVVLESELFGHERARSPARGREARPVRGGRRRHLVPRRDWRASLGDDAGEAPARAPRGRDASRGGSRPANLDVRFVAATEPRPQSGRRRGRLREDSLYRLEVMRILVPALRERKEDINALVQHFLQLHSERLGRPIPRVAPASRRSSRPMICQATSASSATSSSARSCSRARASSRCTIRLLRSATRRAPPPADLSEDWPTLAVLSRRYIDCVLVYTGGNKTRAADVLGIDRRTLNRMFAREKAALQASGTDQHLDDDDDDDSAD